MPCRGFQTFDKRLDNIERALRHFQLSMPEMVVDAGPAQAGPLRDDTHCGAMKAVCPEDAGHVGDDVQMLPRIAHASTLPIRVLCLIRRRISQKFIELKHVAVWIAHEDHLATTAVDVGPVCDANTLLAELANKGV